MTNDTPNFNNIDNIEFIRFMHKEIMEAAFKMMTEGLPGDNKVEPGKPMIRPIAVKPKEQKGEGVTITIADYDIWSQRNLLENQHLRMWGKDTPVVDLLGNIADTELKIEKQRPSHASEAGKRPPLTAKEMELLREFMRKDFGDD